MGKKNDSLPSSRLLQYSNLRRTQNVFFLAMQYNTLRKHSLLQTNSETIKYMSIWLFCIVSLRELFLLSALGAAAIPLRVFPQHVRSGHYSPSVTCLMSENQKCSCFSKSWCAHSVWERFRGSASTRWEYKNGLPWGVAVRFFSSGRRTVGQETKLDAPKLSATVCKVVLFRSFK